MLWHADQLYGELYKIIHCLTTEFRVKFQAKNDIVRIANRWERHRFLNWNLTWNSPVGSEFSLNRKAKEKPNDWAKPNVLYFCEPLQCANDGDPFKVSCKDLANRKQYSNVVEKAVLHILVFRKQKKKEAQEQSTKLDAKKKKPLG